MTDDAKRMAEEVEAAHNHLARAPGGWSQGVTDLLDRLLARVKEQADTIAMMTGQLHASREMVHEARAERDALKARVDREQIIWGDGMNRVHVPSGTTWEWDGKAWSHWFQLDYGDAGLFVSRTGDMFHWEHRVLDPWGTKRGEHFGDEKDEADAFRAALNSAAVPAKKAGA